MQAHPKQVASEAAKLHRTEMAGEANRRSAMRRLNRILGTTAAIVALVGLPVTAWATIAGGSHDLSGGAGGGEICVVCHTPHNGDTTMAEAPLWDHDITSVTDYTTYSSATLDATDIGQPGMASKLCLSCHDGTVAIDAFGTNTGSSFMASTSTAYVGQDLSNDHPIGFTYDTGLATADGGLHDPSTTDASITLRPGNIDTAMLFADKLECASCHDAHDAAGYGKFLRKSNTSPASGLCLTCHNK
jgi:predicted CXXCH cytochrome family protein